MTTLQKISKLEAIALIVMITINQILLNLPNIIITDVGSSAWINVIFVSIIAFLFCLLICKLFKPFPTQDIIDISEYLGKKILKTIIGILYILFFTFIAALFLSYLAISLRIIYFEKSPIIFLLLLLLIPVTFATRLGIKPISNTNLIISPIVILSLIVILFANVSDFIPQRIFPILGFGTNETFLIGLNNIFSFSCFAYLYFLIPMLKKADDFKKVALTSIIISSIFLFLSIICLIMLFPFIHFSDQLLSVYLVARLIEFGKFFQRIDAVFILIWILSSFSFLSITIEFINRIFKKLTKIKTHKEMTFSIATIILSIALCIQDMSNIKFMQNIIFRYSSIILVFIISLIILLLANLKHKKEKSK